MREEYVSGLNTERSRSVFERSFKKIIGQTQAKYVILLRATLLSKLLELRLQHPEVRVEELEPLFQQNGVLAKEPIYDLFGEV